MRASPPDEAARWVRRSGGRGGGGGVSRGRARERMVWRVEGERGERMKVRQRESSAFWTLNEGFSVVAPISVMAPLSTGLRKTSCWVLLKR